jgi:hypothetical protein
MRQWKSAPNDRVCCFDPQAGLSDSWPKAAQNLAYPVLISAAVRNPSFLRCNPERSARALLAAADKLGIGMMDMSAAVLRMPSLIGRAPDGIAKRVRLAARISAALGRPLSHSEIMARMPAVPTYSVDRLLVRHLVARLGLWKWDAGSLIAKSDLHVRSLLDNHANQLPAGSREARKLDAIIRRRMRESA